MYPTHLKTSINFWSIHLHSLNYFNLPKLLTPFGVSPGHYTFTPCHWLDSTCSLTTTLTHLWNVPGHPPRGLFGRDTILLTPPSVGGEPVQSLPQGPAEGCSLGLLEGGVGQGPLEQDGPAGREGRNTRPPFPQVDHRPKRLGSFYSPWVFLISLSFSMLQLGQKAYYLPK